MSNKSDLRQEWYRGLQELSDASFPKKCSNCGLVFQTAQQFLTETEDVRRNQSGLKSSIDDDDVTVVVEMYRNCRCGSTLMDFFEDRRDESAAGVGRREKFDELHRLLVDSGLDGESARNELRKIMRGEESATLSKLQFPGEVVAPKSS